MKFIKIIFIFLLFSIHLFASDLFDLKTLPDLNYQPDTSGLSPFEIMNRTQSSFHNFVKGLEEFNKSSYKSAREHFWSALTESPWDNKYYLWYETVLYKLGELEYLKEYYNKMLSYNMYNNFVNKRLKFISNIQKYEKQYPNFEYTLLNTITGFGIRLRERYFVTPSDILYHNRNIYIVCPTLKQISIFNKNYKLVNRIGFSGKPLKITKSANNVYTFDFDNNKIFRISEREAIEINTSNIDFLGIRSIAADKFDNIYVYDSGNRRIVKFKDNRILMEIGGRINTEVRFNNITDIAVDNDNNIFAVDNRTKNIYKFDSSGNLMSELNYLKIADDIFDIKFRNNNLYILMSDYTLYSFDNMLNKIKTIAIPKDNKIHPAYAFDFDDNMNIYVSNYYDSIVDIYKDVIYENVPLIINIDRIDYRNFYPLIVKYVNVYDIYGGRVYDLKREHLEVFEGFNEDENKMLWDVTYNLYKPEITVEIDTANGVDANGIDTELIEYRRNFLVFPVNLRPVNRLLVYNDIDLTISVINNKSLENYKSNFHLHFENLLDAINYRNTRINLKLISDTDSYLLTDTTDRFQLLREIRSIEYSDKEEKNLFESLLNILHKKTSGSKNKGLIIFMDKTDYKFKKGEVEKIINYLTFNDIPLIIYSFDTEKNKDLEKIINLTQGQYNIYPKFNYKDDLNFIVNRPVNRYVITYESGYTGLISNTYLPVYIFMNYFGMSGGVISGYITPF